MSNIYYRENDYMVGVCSNCDTRFKFDVEDYESIQQHTWWQHKKGIDTAINGKSIGLARFLFPDFPHNKHILLRFPMDYRKQNLITSNMYNLINDNIYEVQCANGRFFFISAEDYGLVSKYTWYVDSNGYVVGKVHGKECKVHRLIMGVKNEKYTDVEIDHIDCDPTNNTRENLRIVDRSLNCFSRSKSSLNRSGYTGVYQSANYDKWCVQISHNGVRRYLGSYATLDEAIRVRKNAELQYFGELSPCAQNNLI